MEFIRLLHDRYGLSEQAAQRLYAMAERIEYTRKEAVVSEGSKDLYTYFVERGSLRTFVMREERCVLLSFSFEGDPATSELGLPTDPTARYYVETMEASTLLRIPRQNLEELFSRDVELANWGRRMAERLLRGHEQYFADYCWREKSEQYLRILEEYPELLHRVPLKELAAYLFVTPQTLSRIRAGIK